MISPLLLLDIFLLFFVSSHSSLLWLCLTPTFCSTERNKDTVHMRCKSLYPIEKALEQPHRVQCILNQAWPLPSGLFHPVKSRYTLRCVLGSKIIQGYISLQSFEILKQGLVKGSKILFKKRKGSGIVQDLRLIRQVFGCYVVRCW